MAKFRFKINGKSKWFGETDTEKKVVKINKKKAKKAHKLLETIVHEDFHTKHPEANEPAAYRAEKKIKTMSKKTKSKMYGKIKRKETPKRV